MLPVPAALPAPAGKSALQTTSTKNKSYCETLFKKYKVDPKNHKQFNTFLNTFFQNPPSNINRTELVNLYRCMVDVQHKRNPPMKPPHFATPETPEPSGSGSRSLWNFLPSIFNRKPQRSEKENIINPIECQRLFRKYGINLTNNSTLNNIIDNLKKHSNYKENNKQELEHVKKCLQTFFNNKKKITYNLNDNECYKLLLKYNINVTNITKFNKSVVLFNTKYNQRNNVEYKTVIKCISKYSDKLQKCNELRAEFKNALKTYFKCIKQNISNNEIENIIQNIS